MLEKDYIVEIVDDFKNLNLEYNEITNIKVKFKRTVIKI